MSRFTITRLLVVALLTLGLLPGLAAASPASQSPTISVVTGVGDLDSGAINDCWSSLYVAYDLSSITDIVPNTGQVSFVFKRPDGTTEYNATVGGVDVQSRTFKHFPARLSTTVELYGHYKKASTMTWVQFDSTSKTRKCKLDAYNAYAANNQMYNSMTIATATSPADQAGSFRVLAYNSGGSVLSDQYVPSWQLGSLSAIVACSGTMAWADVYPAVKYRNVSSAPYYYVHFGGSRYTCSTGTVTSLGIQ